MTVIDTVNRIFREFKRYTGDGLPGEPTGAPLPVGDPQSGPYSAKKSELRSAFTEILSAAGEDAEEAAQILAEFERLYLGAKASDPATDNEGGALEIGALYFNTTDGKFRVWSGLSWQDQSTALGDGEVTTPKLADAAVTNAKLANMAAGTIKGRAVGAGTGAPTDLTPDQVREIAGSVPRGHYYGLTLSNNVTDATNDIDIAAGEAASDDTNPVLMKLASALTKRTDAAWAVGSGNGAWLDGSAMPNGTGHVFLMQRSDTGVIDIGISASATAPVLPANYDCKRRIGAIIRDSGVILPFSQAGNKFLLKTPVNVSVGNDPGTSAVLQTMKVPIGIQVDLLAEIYMQSTDANRRALKITSPDQNDVTPAAGTMSTFVAGTTAAAGNISGPFEVRTNTSGQFRFRLDGSSATTSLFFTANGWIDAI